MIFDISSLFKAEKTTTEHSLSCRHIVTSDSHRPDILINNPEASNKLATFTLTDGKHFAEIDLEDPWCLASIAHSLSPGTYYLPNHVLSPMQIASWALGQYEFKAHSNNSISSENQRILVVEDESTLKAGQAIAQATWLVRDLINQPANLLGPAELETYSQSIAQKHRASISVTSGKELEKEFPAAYAVGKAAAPERQPRILDLSWGNKGPQICLVGKGVCYDTGGLNLKPGSFMRNMKKDMGGAAQVLGLADLIMSLQLPVQLRVIIGAVENSVAPNSFRPGDVIKTRKGLTVEIGNTDAEGRLVLADCLTLAQETSPPDLLVNFATLTGAARVALGTAMPAVFSNEQPLADKLVAFSHECTDPMWSLPLYLPYEKLLNSPIADLGNISESERYGDAIVAALFLNKFVNNSVPWVHIDCFAWNNEHKPGRPKGGEAQGLRAVLGLIEDHIAKENDDCQLGLNDG